MKRSKKYLGRKVRIIQNMDGYNNNILAEINIIQDFEGFVDYAKTFYGDDVEVKLIEDNLTLYKCDTRKTDKLNEQCNIRDRWAKGIFDYRDYFTKKEIEHMLKDNYFVAVQGLQEIDLADLDKLED